MRLLDTSTLQFKEFITAPEWQYAVLSHRWGEEEVSYKEFRKSPDDVKHRAGYRKIIEFCHFARRRGYAWAWVDTCCIDKRSSAELSEAINSMYMWYRMSGECHVLLNDYRGSFRDCEWFSRGWTLQELLAPEVAIFCTNKWEVLGHKHKYRFCRCESREESHRSFGSDLVPALTRHTGISEKYLSRKARRIDASIAERMSWASRRTTTRIEDRAYCLLGLFDINMPLLYGEGAKAFQRLQREILQVSDDTSIFCFIPVSRKDRLLASGPEDFKHCRGVRRGHLRSSEPYSITNKGLRIHNFAESTELPGVYPNKGDGEVYSDYGAATYRIKLGCVGPFLDASFRVSRKWAQQYLIVSEAGEGQYRRLMVVPNQARWDSPREHVFNVRFY